jgi:hypothetical protein
VDSVLKTTMLTTTMQTMTMLTMTMQTMTLLKTSHHFPLLNSRNVARQQAYLLAARKQIWSLVFPKKKSELVFAPIE